MTSKHPTSSVFVFRRTPAGWQLGLIRHPRLGRMMIPGGHVEHEESQAEAALREVAEETGLAVRLVSPPAPPLPGGYQRQRVAQPWWIVEYDVPSDNHLGAAHVHIDHLYVALACGDRVGEPAHPFGWYTAADLPRLDMFEGARTMALALLSGLSTVADGADSARLGAALLARLLPGFPRPEGADCVDGVRLGGGLVRPVPQHAGEPQRHPARVPRAGLHPVERDLDHQLGPHPEHPPGVPRIPHGR